MRRLHTEQRQEVGSDALLADSGTAFSAKLAAAAANEPEAIRALTEEYLPGLIAFARRRGATDPGGVANTALFDAFRHLSSFRGRDERAFRAYLYRILRRRVVDEFRRQGSWPRLTAGDDGRMVDSLIDETSTGFENTVVETESVNDLLAHLTDDQREVVQMRVFTGLSIKETASQTGRSVTAVKAMQKRAFTSLRSLVLTTAIILLSFLAIKYFLELRKGPIVVENEPVEQPAPDQVNSLGDNNELLTVDGDSGELDVAVGTTDSTTSGALAARSENAEGAGSGRCLVLTDGSPAVGELAFVTHQAVSGELEPDWIPEVRGPNRSSALLPDHEKIDRETGDIAWPFVVDKTMFSGERFTPGARLVNGERSSTCSVESDGIPPPCVVTADASPAVGESASVRYRHRYPYSVFDSQPTYILGNDGQSAFLNRPPATYRTRKDIAFNIDESMFADGRFSPSTAFADGAGRASCRTVRS